VRERERERENNKIIPRYYERQICVYTRKLRKNMTDTNGVTSLMES